MAVNLQREYEERGRRIAELEARLEIDPSHDYDGISARDATIRLLEEKVKRLQSRGIEDMKFTILQLEEALAYARRFVTKDDVDTDFIDAVLAESRGGQ